MPAASPPASHYWLLIDNVSQGPFDVATIQAKLSAGELTLATPACPLGSQTWSTLALFFSSEAIPATPPFSGDWMGTNTPPSIALPDCHEETDQEFREQRNGNGHDRNGPPLSQGRKRRSQRKQKSTGLEDASAIMAQDDLPRKNGYDEEDDENGHDLSDSMAKGDLKVQEYPCAFCRTTCGTYTILNSYDDNLAQWKCRACNCLSDAAKNCMSMTFVRMQQLGKPITVYLLCRSWKIMPILSLLMEDTVDTKVKCRNCAWFVGRRVAGVSTCEQGFVESTRTLLKPSSLAAGGAVGLAILGWISVKSSATIDGDFLRESRKQLGDICSFYSLHL